MAKPKRAQRPASAGASRPGAIGASARPPSPRTPATANGHSNSTTSSATPRTGKIASTPGGAPNGAKATAKNGISATGGRTTSTAARTIAARAASPAKSRRRQQPSGLQRAIGGQRGVWIALVSIALVVTFFFILSRMNGGTPDRQPVPATVYTQVTQVSPEVLAKVGTGGLNAPFQATPSGTKLLTNGGKPEVLFMGAEYCPHCAAERWPLVVALSHFGTFSNLRIEKSTTNDTPPDVPTFTFYQAKYTSPYITFTSVELQDRAGNTLENPTAEQSAIFKQYDAPPYTTQAGAIPFLSLGNQYIQIGEGVPSTLIATDTWQSIGSALSDPNTPEAQNILGNANYLTAAICKMTNNQPANVCTAAPIPDIQQKLPKGS
ncbi:MAG TPA: DUF929 family protein [Ktedonobacterales bacterium]|nr:DUF929 family protein [Ktedonobacterales bacterium]